MEGSIKELMMGENIGLTLGPLGNLCGIGKLLTTGREVWRSMKVRVFAVKELVAGITIEVEAIVHWGSAPQEVQSISLFALANITTHLPALLAGRSGSQGGEGLKPSQGFMFQQIPTLKSPLGS